MNSPLSTFDFHPVLNEAAMAAVVPGPVILAGQSVRMMVDDIRKTNRDKTEGSYEAWFDVAKNKLDIAYNNGQLERGEYDKGIDAIQKSREVLSNTNLKDVKSPLQRGLIIGRLLDSQEHQGKINELQAEINKIKKDVGESAKTTSIDKEIALLQEKINRNTEAVIRKNC